MSLQVRAAPIAAAFLVLSGGCLSTAHRIPKQELLALAQKPPEQRGQRVRVIQGFAGEDEPPEAPAVQAGTHVYVGGGVQVSGGSAHHGPHFKKAAAAKADDARWWLIAAGLVAAGLAVTEGARYDGWVELNPMHPVHLYGPYGEYTWVPLAQLDPKTAAWARKAYVRETEGPWHPLGRAPLDRTGWTYSVLLGAAEIPSAAEKNAFGPGDTGEPGFMGHIQLGLFPSQMLGFLLDFGLGYRNNQFGNTVFEARNALELQLLPLSAGRFHAGAYGDLGVGLRAEDGIKSSSERRAFLGGAGALLQLELTTRLTITGRLGVTEIFGETTSEAGVGVSIY